MSIHPIVICTNPKIKPYDHGDLWFSITFMRWVFAGQTASDFPYSTTNNIAAQLGLEPNPEAIPRLWEAWHRVAGNEYEYAQLVIEQDRIRAFHVAQQRRDDPLMMVRELCLQPMEQGQEWNQYAESVLSSMGGDQWTQTQSLTFKEQLRIACSFGYGGPVAQAAVQEAR